MKKVCAMKILCAVLAIVMVLGTGVSAMADVSGVTNVTYNVGTGAYSVKTTVSGLEGNEMVTYMVHDAANMYELTPADIDYIDQQTATGTQLEFGYSDDDGWNENNKVYIGTENLNAPVVGGANVVEAGVPVVKINNVQVKGLTISGGEGVTTIALPAGAAAITADVRLNGEAIDFVKVGNAIAFEAEDLDESDVVAISAGSATFTGDKTNNGVLSSADIIEMEKAQPLTDTLNGTNNVPRQTGYVISWNSVVADINGNASGNVAEARSNMWYPSTKSYAEMGIPTSPVEIKRSSAAPLAGNTGKSRSYAFDLGIEDQIDSFVAEYNTDNSITSFTIDPANYIPSGVYLNTDDMTLEATVPVSGEYVLIVADYQGAGNRQVQLNINGVTLKAGADLNKHGAFYRYKSAETVTLEAGTPYDVVLDANGIIRFDFLALVPATEATNEIYEDAATSGFKSGLMTYFSKLAGDFDGVTNVNATFSQIVMYTPFCSKTSVTTFCYARGYFTECGVEIDGVKYPALGVHSGYGSQYQNEKPIFAIELVDETPEADLLAELGEVRGYLIDKNGDELYTELARAIE